ncbi:hypothetical protein BH20CHL6_BH20CHL6_00630 [soil metagenome]
MPGPERPVRRAPAGVTAGDRPEPLSAHGRAHLAGEVHAHVRFDPTRPVYVISVAASILSVHPRTLRIYEGEGLVCPARTPSNIRLYSENDIRRVLWIRHLTQNLGVNLAGVRVLFELEERLGTRILESLFTDRPEGSDEEVQPGTERHTERAPTTSSRRRTTVAVHFTDQGDLDVRNDEQAAVHGRKARG